MIIVFINQDYHTMGKPQSERRQRCPPLTGTSTVIHNSDNYLVDYLVQGERQFQLIVVQARKQNLLNFCFSAWKDLLISMLKIPYLVLRSVKACPFRLTETENNFKWQPILDKGVLFFTGWCKFFRSKSFSLLNFFTFHSCEL